MRFRPLVKIQFIQFGFLNPPADAVYLCDSRTRPWLMAVLDETATTRQPFMADDAVPRIIVRQLIIDFSIGAVFISLQERTGCAGWTKALTCSGQRGMEFYLYNGFGEQAMCRRGSLSAIWTSISDDTWLW